MIQNRIFLLHHISKRLDNRRNVYTQLAVFTLQYRLCHRSDFEIKMRLKDLNIPKNNYSHSNEI